MHYCLAHPPFTRLFFSLYLTEAVIAATIPEFVFLAIIAVVAIVSCLFYKRLSKVASLHDLEEAEPAKGIEMCQFKEVPSCNL